MTPVELFAPLPARLASRYRRAQHVHTTYDCFGAVAAEYTFFTGPQVLYVRWQGHVTSDELVRAAQVGLQLNLQWQPRGLFHDTRGTSGEWGEASSWVVHEWIPSIQAQCPHLRGIAFLLEQGMPMPYANQQLMGHLREQFELHVFYSPTLAWQWLDERTKGAA
ncbi:hypothetical protein [Hymenobacter sp. BT730]|uniref:hypothetical protein n=1 Tax=Hymenobacter sp. BT730 TaxID=3063332 RepID=UPI0026E009C3|nr:hypothetical protein [Hymenobacter sp. BT730]